MKEAAARGGLLYGLSAYIIWGVIPIYFKAVSHVKPLVVLYHRIIWSALFMCLIVSLRKEWPPIVRAAREPRRLMLLSLGAVLIALNWLTFIYAVSARQLLQASLGYFINPLVSIALGMFFLGERLRGWQWAAVAIAGLAVGYMASHGTGFPWIAVALALSFGFYGLVRKKVDINSLHGLLVESIILFPVALIALEVLPHSEMSRSTLGLLSLSGVITAVPLLCFGAALRRLRLSTMGFLQYVGPTLQFVVATCVFREPLDRIKLTSFGLCWLAILVYLIDSVMSRQPQPVADEPE